jgi:glycosyltransferase involved in cell wall biosynthesis
MKILNSLYYYRPHYSGLTVYTERLARELASRGHTISVLTSRYDASLPRLEQLEGVNVHRVNVAFRVSKGPIMPALLPAARSLLQEHDVLHLHVPQLDAAPLAYIARRMGKPVVVTYHCDLSLPPTFLNSIANVLSRAANRITVAAADRVVVNTLDYAQQSRLLSRHMDKVIAIPPPIEIPPVEQQRVAALRARSGAGQARPIIGMAARLASEKGAEILVRALPEILRHHPEARVLYVGQYEDVLGEQSYGRRIRDLLKPLQEHWTFLGILDPGDLAAFFGLCDVTILPSLNSTESFGMVQVESMFCGTPVVASDLPGVREVTATTGMGVVFPAGDHAALAASVLQILESPKSYGRDAGAIRARFGTPVVANRYEELFRTLPEPRPEGSHA